MHKRSLKGNLQRSKRSLKTTRVYEHEVIKLNTLKTRRLVRGILKVTFIVEKGPFVPQKGGRVKKVKEFDKFDSRKMTLNFQAMNILSYALDANEYNRVSGCDLAHEM
ncbi:hypothetical protein M9H77_07218 [Catharanthus roseus]|uniref:Uncharacterized protein n=1 Tax=Catharanthus roseus TaxID=4058 RepID=A0ACC0BUC0_CATRO|nr:hypothetical protein M9H77_07218 [Catharanthus roseus]